jgi:hypothetical protein
MASTNEDAVALASTRFEEGRVLILRHLPDRGTIELGWWEDDGGALLPTTPMLEFPAEAFELEALATLCREALRGPAMSPPLTEGARLVARADGDGVTLAREPEEASQVTLPREALDRLVDEMLPAARARIEKLGFGLPQRAG